LQYHHRDHNRKAVEMALLTSVRSSLSSLRPPLRIPRPNRSELIGDLSAGVIAAFLILAYSLSYSALLFPGPMNGMAALSLWSMLIGAVATGIIVGWFTGLPPLGVGMDTPSMAVFMALSHSIMATATSQGIGPADAAFHALLGVWLASLYCSVMLLVLGWLRLGNIFRFIPYGVVGGFLGATGFLLIIAGISLVTGKQVELTHFSAEIAGGNLDKLGVALVFAASLLAARRLTRSALAVPLVFLLGCIVVSVLLTRGVIGTGGDGWFLTDTAGATAWLPLDAVQSSVINWPLLAEFVPQAAAATVVILLSIVIKISSLEAWRADATDLNKELRLIGAGSILGAGAGGFSATVVVSISQLLTLAGAKTRFAGVIAAILAGSSLLLHFDLAHWTPIPILGGLVICLGILQFVGSLYRPLSQGAWVDLGLAVGIMLISIQYGYLSGVVAGIIMSCLIFAYSYGRIGVIRRKVTRASFSSNVQWDARSASILQSEGDAIHIYWLRGYVFFGSSDRVYAEIKRATEEQKGQPVRFIVLDCADVMGTDASAILSFAKLSSFCVERRVTLVFCGMPKTSLIQLQKSGLLREGKPHRVFASRSEALSWCEGQVLAAAGAAERPNSGDGFGRWLSEEVRTQVPIETLMRYFVRREYESGQSLYAQGDPAETIDIVASGSVDIVHQSLSGPTVLRSMKTHTVIGEMGFFRSRPRAASVLTSGRTVLYTLNRQAYEEMIRDNPRLALDFQAFIIRSLSDRVEFANREVSALV
jgi:SulP family sulfate permease